MKFLLKNLLLICLLFAVPAVASAFELVIPKSLIDVQLQENGDLHVTEKNTYEFEGEFNGVTRDIRMGDHPVSDFTASENDQPLKVERDGSLYRIYRGGEDATFDLTLTYTIENFVDKYNDIGEVYIGFIDDGNETPYEELTIAFTPPEPTETVISFGEDATFGQDEVDENGVVTFTITDIDDGTSVPTRVAFDAALFDAAPLYEDTNRTEELLAMEQQMIDDAIALAERQETLREIAIIAIPVLGGLFLVWMIVSYGQSISKQRAVLARSDRPVPESSWPMPEIAQFSRSALSPDALTGATIDLVRRGFVKEEKSGLTYLHREGATAHETLLLDWLFHDIGHNGSVTHDEIDHYWKNMTDYKGFTAFYQKWNAEIQKAVKARELTEPNTLSRTIMGIMSAGTAVFALLFGVNELYGWMAISIPLAFVMMTMSLLNRPFTWEGATVWHEWNQLRKRADKVSHDEWESWTEEERMAFLSYGTTISNYVMINKNKEFAEKWRKQREGHAATPAASFDFLTMILLYSAMTSSHQSSSAYAASQSSGGGTPGGGGGSVGGTGGGSGGF